MPDILVLTAHPQLEHSRATRALMQAGLQLQTQDPTRVQVRDLYATYPDYSIDVAAEQTLLQSCQLLVWLQPVHWYGMPPLLKLWLDEVFAFGWAYGPGGQALAGKNLWLAASTGGHEDSYHPAGYNRYFFDAFLPPYEQTAALVGMRWLPPLVLHGAHRAAQPVLQAHADVFAQRLASWPAWPELQAGADDDATLNCRVPADARPAT
jgi:glutathione-regulated potassium-efflux system ancillary protein KefF